MKKIKLLLLFALLITNLVAQQKTHIVKDLKITIQDLGWRSEGRYLPQQSDISSVVYWYQAEPHTPFPKLPEKNKLEVN